MQDFVVLFEFARKEKPIYSRRGNETLTSSLSRHNRQETHIGSAQLKFALVFMRNKPESLINLRFMLEFTTVTSTKPSLTKFCNKQD